MLLLRADYVLYQPCFANPSVQSEAGQCNATLSANLQNLLHYNTSYARARLCQYGYIIACLHSCTLYKLFVFT